MPKTLKLTEYDARSAEWLAMIIRGRTASDIATDEGLSKVAVSVAVNNFVKRASKFRFKRGRPVIL